MSHKCSCRAHLLYPCGKELFSRALVDNAVCECVCVCVCVCSAIELYIPRHKKKCRTGKKHRILKPASQYKFFLNFLLS